MELWKLLKASKFHFARIKNTSDFPTFAIHQTKNMARIFFPLLFIFASISSFSQNVALRGKVLDGTTQLPLESATVYITREKDSTVIDYTITEKSGIFVINTRKTDSPMILKISYTGFQTYSERLEKIDGDRDFGFLPIVPIENALGEVVVKAEAPPVRIKNDTLEFNAASFKLRPDANVESLLKQLPGVDIDDDGKITVNGKEVNQVLVNGKPFFDKDGKIAIQNLPSDIINKVQVTDSKTKAEEISGKAASSDNASINLTIDEDKNKGLFGKAMVGGGTDGRYEASLLVNYFKGDRKISVLGARNNINTSGFSMDEVFDSMGGGRNVSIWTSDDGSFAINGMRFGGGKGIKTTDIFGINLADNWFEKIDASGSYFYTGASSENNNRTRSVNFLPEKTLTTESSSRTEDDSFANNYSFEAEYKIDSTTTITINPKLTLAKSFNRNRAQQSTFDEVNLINESESFDTGENDRQQVENAIYFFKSLNKKGRAISIDWDNTNSKTLEKYLSQSENTFYSDLDNDGIIDEITQDDRNQVRRLRNLSDAYYAEITYQEPLRDSMTLGVVAKYQTDKGLSDKRTFDFNPETGEHDLFNDVLSMYVIGAWREFTPGVSFEWTKKKYNLRANAGTNVTHYDAEAVYMGEQTKLRRKYLYPDANVHFSYRFSKSASLWSMYSYNIQVPQAMQILPISDLSNPFVTVTGNPDLNPIQRHYAYASFRNYDFATKSGYSFYAGGQYYMDQIATSTVYDDAGRRTMSYVNIDNTFGSWFGGNWSRQIKREEHTFKLTLAMNGNFNKTKGFIDGQQFESQSVSMTPRINLSYDYGELLSINPMYRFTYSETNYSNYVIDRATNVFHTLTLQTTSYWPKHVVFGNDFTYSYNSRIADGFKKDFFLWNISLGYNFFNDKLLAKVKVYDLLDQNQSQTRTITATSIRDEENTVLRRYMMFSLTYKLERFAGKKKEQTRFWMH